MTYLRLMRFHKPVGIWLLWAPTAWALWIANQGHPPLKLVVLFALGVMLMRAAGCVMNDIADSAIDKQVARTKTRPLASGELTFLQALVLLCFLLLAAFVVVLCLPFSCFLWSLASLSLSLFYPLCKRFFHCPQLILGLSFSMGIPMAYSASQVSFDETALLLFIINIFWILAYDTLYAIADRADDARIGVKSAALLFGSYDKLFIALFQLIFHGLWLYVAALEGFSDLFYFDWILAAFLLIYQQYLVFAREPGDCLRAFTSNGYYGILLWMSIVLQ